jgi:hypothetical protein
MTKIIEIDRKVITFLHPDKSRDWHATYPICDGSQVWLVCEKHAPDIPPVWRTFGRMGQAYSLLGQLCGKEAVQAEFKDRLVNDKPIKFEAYLALWREAIERREHLSSLCDHGMQLVATLSVPVAVLTAYDNAQRKQSLDEAIQLGFVVSTTDELITFKIPLNDLPTSLLYAKISGWHVDPEKYPFSAPSVLEVVMTGAGRGERAPLRDGRDLFLFADEGVAA